MEEAEAKRTALLQDRGMPPGISWTTPSSR